MDIENWLSPHWSWALLVYPLWRAIEACPWLLWCSLGTLVAMAGLAAALAFARDLAEVGRLLSET